MKNVTKFPTLAQTVWQLNSNGHIQYMELHKSGICRHVNFTQISGNKISESVNYVACGRICGTTRTQMGERWP
jgi:hypothetical protein